MSLSVTLGLGGGTVPLLPAPQGEASLFPTHRLCIARSPARGTRPWDRNRLSRDLSTVAERGRSLSPAGEMGRLLDR